MFYRLLSIDESIVYKVPTIRRLLALFDNYEMDVSRRENVTPHKLREDDNFINAVLDTQVMQTAMYFLNKKGLQIECTWFFSIFIKNIISNLVEILHRFGKR